MFLYHGLHLFIRTVSVHPHPFASNDAEKLTVFSFAIFDVGVEVAEG